MKIATNSVKVNEVKIDDILVGETFVVERKSRKDEIGYYMKIDRNSGLVWKGTSTPQYVAVNLITGQLRAFPLGAMVVPHEITLNI